MHELLKLEAATGSQTLELDQFCPHSLHMAEAMPSLTRLAVSSMPVGSPRQRQRQSLFSLVEFKPIDLQSTSLPDWFAQLTGLKLSKLNKFLFERVPHLHISLDSAGTA